MEDLNLEIARLQKSPPASIPLSLVSCSTQTDPLETDEYLNLGKLFNQPDEWSKITPVAEPQPRTVRLGGYRAIPLS